MISRVFLAATAIVLTTGCAGTGRTSLPFASQGAVGAVRARAAEKVLYSFTGETDGAAPNGSHVFDGPVIVYGGPTRRDIQVRR